MIETLLALVPRYGVFVVAAATYLSCLAVPVPTSMILLTAGAFAAAGDLALPGAAGLALAGAVLGDQTGYALARFGGAALARPARPDSDAARLRDRARRLTRRWGGPGVFLSRWLFSPLGPYVNFAAGAAAMDWPRFALWAAAGEVVWVGLYLGLGYGFGDRIEALAQILGNMSGALAAAAVAAGLGLWLAAAMRADRRRGRRPRGLPGPPP